jgi:hypothetical protein
MPYPAKVVGVLVIFVHETDVMAPSETAPGATLKARSACIAGTMATFGSKVELPTWTCSCKPTWVRMLVGIAGIPFSEVLPSSTA